MIEAAPRLGAIGRARASVAALRTLARMRREARTVAHDDEREILAGWSGWGPLAPMFAPKDQTWADIAEEVRSLLPAEDVELGSRGTYNAFYTPTDVAESMWGILRSLGFTGGKVLEPGCGGGVFLRTAPDGVEMTGVERDPTAAAICAAQHPDATVHVGKLQETRLVAGYAAAIGNVPYADVRVFDANAPAAVRSSLHNYFIWRTMSALAPGGVAVLLTSRYTMDATGDEHRAEIAALADFVGAIRLPNGGLAGGTDIVADVVILRRKDETRTYGQPFRDTVYVPGIGFINKWWQEEPGAVLGEMSEGRTSQYGLSVTVKARPGDLPAAHGIAKVGADIVEQARKRNLLWIGPEDVTALGDVDDLTTPEGWHEGSYHLVGGKVHKVEGGRTVPVARAGKELEALIGLRDLAVKLVEQEADHSLPDAEIEPVRRQCRAAYLRYVKQFGALNRGDVVNGKPDEDGRPTLVRRNPRMGGFRSDPDAQLVFALEVFDQDTNESKPAPILSSRQNVPPVRPTRTDDPEQALAWCLDRRGGRVDLDYIAALLGRSVSLGDGAGPVGEQSERIRRDIAGMLGDKVFCDPETRDYQTAEEYLSGNVRGKHRKAITAAEADPSFAVNVTALERVLPKLLGPGEITANLGAPWIGPDDVQQFVQELLGYAAEVKRIKSTNAWEVDSYGTGTVAATADWGTPDANAYKLIADALNGKTPIVYREVTIGGRDVRRKDPEASLLASEKQQRIRDRFAEWVWEDPDRTDRLVNLYNELYNSLAPRKFSGEHITVDGLAPWFKPYPHQLEYVARAMATPAALCGHPVGAGKTASMAMTAMKLRQTGLARKPLVVVPNHLIEQITREFRQLFPSARILSASAKTIAENRRAFAARCATGDWDIVVMTHSAFGPSGLPVAAQTEEAYLHEQIADLEQSIAEACPDGELEGRMVKNAAKRKDTLEERILELRHTARGRDKGVTFEQLGVDYILIDEAHYYKNLAVPVRTDGFSVRPSKRATDLDMKLQWLGRRGSGRYASLFTGTPVSNTMLELYVVLHYLMPEHLREIGLASADSWAAAFVQFVTSVDVTVDGGQFELRTRPALFFNAPELRMLVSQVADIRTAEQLGLKRPAADVQTIVVQPTPAQREYTRELVDRARDCRSRGRNIQPGDDNMLAVCGDGRRMATDPVLVGLWDPEPGKLDAVAEEMVKFWRANPEDLQIGFLDLGTPNKDRGPQTYGRLRDMLVAAGMERGRIRFIHDADSDVAKAALFADCRSGKVSVVLGSTDKLGVGTNIQDRVVAMHHIDAPYRPADVEQRDGRGLRPGNRHSVVAVRRYVTERTFDAYMWQMLTRKIGFISQVTSGQLDRTVEDVTSDGVMSFAAVKASATGQPLLLEKAEIDARIKKLRGLQRNHRSTVDRMKRDIPHMQERAGHKEREAEAWEAIAANAGDLAENDGDRLATLTESYSSFSAPSGVFAGVRVSASAWTQTGKQPERHPMLLVNGGGGNVELRAYRFWKPARYAQELGKLLATADAMAGPLRSTVTRLRSEIASSEEMAVRPFEQADELTAALARLDQIEAALHAAAVRNEEDEAVPADAEPVATVPADTAPVDGLGDLGDLDSFFDSFEAELSTELAELEAQLATELDDLLAMLA
ncbi:DEAD/DEAH box helicase family protein [Micromonospora sp. DT227]|uniref:DEAD/DEAH box helicase family protein n=1 Tax=Micromonospora sp. DT227 TaxID=3393433 RepID=UPI003CF5A89B